MPLPPPFHILLVQLEVGNFRGPPSGPCGPGHRQDPPGKPLKPNNLDKESGLKSKATAEKSGLLYTVKLPVSRSLPRATLSSPVSMNSRRNKDKLGPASPFSLRKSYLVILLLLPALASLRSHSCSFSLFELRARKLTGLLTCPVRAQSLTERSRVQYCPPGVSFLSCGRIDWLTFSTESIAAKTEGLPARREKREKGKSSNTRSIAEQTSANPANRGKQPHQPV